MRMQKKASEHILQECKLFQKMRAEIWSLPVPLDIKLYRSLAALLYLKRWPTNVAKSNDSNNILGHLAQVWGFPVMLVLHT